MFLKLFFVFCFMVEKRLDWDEYFMNIVKVVAQRATCDRGKCGAIAVRNKRILATGYVGSPAGLPHCDEVGHKLKKMIHEDGTITQHCVRTIHAEPNVICQAARFGIPLNEATIYVLFTPCRNCAMLIINSGIKRVVCNQRYHDYKDTEEMFKQAGVELEYFSKEIVKYENQ